MNAIGNARPEQVFVRSRDAAVQNDSPLLRVGGGKAQALEGNRHQQHVTFASEAAFGVPHRIEGLVEPAVIEWETLADGTLRPERVPLDAQWIRSEGVTPARIVEGIDHDFGRII